MRMLFHAFAIGTVVGAVAATARNAGGTVEVSSLGLVELTPENTPAMPTLHVRFVLANTAGRTPWTFDASAAELESGSWRAPTTFVNSDVRTLPVIEIAPGDHATVDLYFALPAVSPDLSQLAITWRMSTGMGMRTERTGVGFNLLAPAPVKRPGWGREWWAAPGIIDPRVPTRVLVTGRNS